MCCRKQFLVLSVFKTCLYCDHVYTHLIYLPNQLHPYFHSLTQSHARTHCYPQTTWMLDAFVSARPELIDPLFILLQVGRRHRFRHFLQSRLEVLHGGGHVHLVPRDVADLFWCEALDSSPHGHQRGISTVSHNTFNETLKAEISGSLMTDFTEYANKPFSPHFILLSAIRV